jgi:hypothetical protein
MRGSERLVERVAEEVGEGVARRWWELGQRTSLAAGCADPAEVNGDLEAQWQKEPQSPVGPLYALWRADAFARGGRYGEAVAAFDEVVTGAEGVKLLGGVEARGAALRARAGVLARAGDVEGAIAAYRTAAREGDRTLLYRAGVVAERAGRFEEAVGLYGEVAAQERTPDSDDRGQRALRARERLAARPGVYTPSLQAVVDLVEGALAERDPERLRRLASPTHFWAGPGGGHYRYESEEVLDWLSADLSRSRPRRVTSGVLGTGRKRYLLTSGWRGKHFRGVVGFAFVECGLGWEWCGLLVSAPSDVWGPRWEPAEKMTNQPLPFGLLAPWPAGRRFTAGGLEQFVWRSSAVAAAVLVPIIGASIGAMLAGAFSLTDCGYGLRGFYYNQGPTHQGQDAFSIDFTTYQRGLPFVNLAGGTPVLCVADGVVRMVDADVASGDDSDANEVQVDHVDPSSGMNRFVSRYLHMTGPFAIPVSVGMPAPVGRRLGVMNDTGNSALDHLHFSVHDTTTGPGIGNSVRPTPMEGLTLGDGASGTCILSTNREAIVVELPAGCVAALGRILGAAFGRG